MNPGYLLSAFLFIAYFKEKHSLAEFPVPCYVDTTNKLGPV